MTRNDAQPRRFEVATIRDRDGFTPTSVSLPLERATRERIGREVQYALEGLHLYDGPHRVVVRYV